MAHNKYVGQKGGATLGSLEEVDISFGEVEWGEFMRVQIRLDISKLLLRRKKFNIGLSKPV